MSGKGNATHPKAGHRLGVGRGKGNGGKNKHSAGCNAGGGKGKGKFKEVKGKGKDKGKADPGAEPDHGQEQRWQMLRVLIPGWEPSWGEPDWSLMFHPYAPFQRECYNSRSSLRPTMHPDHAPPAGTQGR